MARAATALFVLLFAAGCFAAGDTGSPSGSRPGTTGALPETTAPNGASRELRVEGVAAGAPGQGPAVPRVVLAPSAAVLSEAIGGGVPDRGDGTYLLAYWGRKPTGGYSLAVESARIEGEQVTVRLALKEPPDAILTQAFIYPYVLVVLGGLDPRGKEFVFEEMGGRRLGWPVRSEGGDGSRGVGFAPAPCEEPFSGDPPREGGRSASLLPVAASEVPLPDKRGGSGMDAKGAKG